ncbi:MAG TPA: hypothetical protein VL242_36270 [Sorangium sp.]|nr:hypothetical protein [Sorangium sp.]
MALTKIEKVHGIIHGASVAAGAAGAGMAQLPGSDYLVLAPIQASMISAIAMVHNRKISDATATAMIGTLGGTVVGRTVSQVLVGWIPGVGNTINAATAVALTEAIGWSAHKYFEKLGDEPSE